MFFYVCFFLVLFDVFVLIFILLNYIFCEGEVLVEKLGFEVVVVLRIDFVVCNMGMEISMWFWFLSFYLVVVVDVVSVVG